MNILLTVPSVMEFKNAHRQARFEGWRNFLTRHTNNLVPYEAVRQALKLGNGIDRGLQEIEVDKIVGSVGRDQEFTPRFLPKHSFTRERWQRVAELSYYNSFTPIVAYKISNVYFVVDGNHRVSVARFRGATTIEAHVIEYLTHVSIHKDDDLNTILQRGDKK